MDKQEKQLLSVFARLPVEQQQQLLDYAEFLGERYALEDPLVSQTPVDIPRPSDESVVKAIRRLAQTYPMLESRDMLHKTSSFMMKHVVHGEDSSAVIDELEIYFRECYENHVSQRKKV